MSRPRSVQRRAPRDLTPDEFGGISAAINAYERGERPLGDPLLGRRDPRVSVTGSGSGITGPEDPDERTRRLTEEASLEEARLRMERRNADLAADFARDRDARDRDAVRHRDEEAARVGTGVGPDDDWLATDPERLFEIFGDDGYGRSLESFQSPEPVTPESVGHLSPEELARLNAEYMEEDDLGPSTPSEGPPTPSELEAIARMREGMRAPAPAPPTRAVMPDPVVTPPARGAPSSKSFGDRADAKGGGDVSPPPAPMSEDDALMSAIEAEPMGPPAPPPRPAIPDAPMSMPPRMAPMSVDEADPLPAPPPPAPMSHGPMPTGPRPLAESMLTGSPNFEPLSSASRVPSPSETREFVRGRDSGAAVETPLATAGSAPAGERGAPARTPLASTPGIALPGLEEAPPMSSTSHGEGYLAPRRSRSLRELEADRAPALPTAERTADDDLWDALNERAPDRPFAFSWERPAPGSEPGATPVAPEPRRGVIRVPDMDVGGGGGGGRRPPSGPMTEEDQNALLIETLMEQGPDGVARAFPEDRRSGEAARFIDEASRAETPLERDIRLSGGAVDLARRGYDIEAAAAADERNRIAGEMAARRELEEQRQTAMAEATRRYQNAIDRASAITIDPDGFYHSRGVGGVIASSIAIGLGAIGAGVNGGTNVALEMIQDEIDRDLQAQAANLDNAWRDADAQSGLVSLTAQEFDSREAALEAARALALEDAAARVAEQMAQLGSEEATHNGQVMVAQLTDAAAAARAAAIEHQQDRELERMNTISRIRGRDATTARTERRGMGGAGGPHSVTAQQMDVYNRAIDSGSTPEQAAIVAGIDPRLIPASGRFSEATSTESAADDAVMDAAVAELMPMLDGDIPGVGLFDRYLHRAFIGDDGRRIRMMVANIEDLLLRSRSGAAITEPERERLHEIVVGMGTEQELRDGINRILSEVAARRSRGTDPRTDAERVSSDASSGGGRRVVED